MIDRIAIQIYGVTDSFIDEKLPEALSVYDDSKGIIKGSYEGLKLTYYHKASMLRIEGSIHKFAKGNNYCRYTFSEVVKTLQDFSTLLEIPLLEFRITNIEVGVNIPVNDTPMRYIETITSYKSNKFIYMTPRSHTSKICGKKCKMAEYSIKFYDKIADYIIDGKVKKEDRKKIPKNILRYEVQLSKKQLQTFGFKNPTAENLCSRKYAMFCANLLYSVLDEVIFNDTSIEFTKIAHKSPKTLHNMVKNYIFVTSDGYDRYLCYLREHVGEDEYKKAKRHKASLLKKYRPLMLVKYEKELRAKFTEEMSNIHDYKRATRKKV